MITTECAAGAQSFRVNYDHLLTYSANPFSDGSTTAKTDLIHVWLRSAAGVRCVLHCTSSSSSPSSYSHFYVGPMYDDIRLRVARS